MKKLNTFCGVVLIMGLLLVNIYTGFTQIHEWEKAPKFGIWLRVEYKNFVFIYEPHTKPFVDRLVKLSDTFYEQYGGIFKHYPKKIEVVVQGRSSIGNGFFTALPPTLGLVVASSDLFTGAKGDDWAGILFTHEYAHFVHQTYEGGLGGVLAKIFGPGAKAIVSIASPPWFDEGLAVNFESDITNTGRLYHPNMILPTRADILLGKENSFFSSTLINTDENEEGRRYQYGMFFVDYLKRRYGYKAIIEMWNKFADFPISMSSRAKTVLGKSLYDLHVEMQADLRERFTRETGDFPRGTQFYAQRYDNTQLGIIGNTDKGLLLYKNTPNGRKTFTFLNLNNKMETNVLNVSIQGGFVSPNNGADITPDGRYIAYVAPIVDTSTTSIISGENFVGGNFVDVFMYDTVLKKNRRLTKGQTLKNPAISPDGAFVVVSQQVLEYQRLIKISVDTARKGYEVLYEPGSAFFSSKAISPDGRYLVFVEKSMLDGNSLKVMDLSTKQVTTLLQRDSALYFSNPRFINNSEITVASDIQMPTKVMMLYKVNIQNNTWVRIARDKVGVQEGILTDTGDVLYVSNSGIGNEIYWYPSSDTDNQSIDLQTVPVFQFDTDRLNKYTDSDIVSVSDTVSSSTTMVSTPKRVWSFVPSRFNLWYPSLGLSFFGAGAFFDINATGLWTSRNGLSNLSVHSINRLAFGKFTFSFQPLYDIIYGYSWFPIGDILLHFSRTYTYDMGLRKYKLAYTNTFRYGRLLYASVFGTTIGLSLGTSITLSEYSDFTISVAESFKHLAAGDYTVANEYSAMLNFRGGEAHGKSAVRRGFGWNIGVGSDYISKLFDIPSHIILGVLDTSVRIPIARYQSITLSAYNTFANFSNYGLTERFERASPTFTLARRGSAVGGGRGTIITPVHSALSIDVRIPFGFFRNVGSFLISPYSAYINLFAEQTIGLTYTGTFMYNEYVVLGQELGVDLNILHFPLRLSVGAALKVPYGKNSNFGYQVYFTFGSVGK